tara:strand:- start:214 stop:630 length:417 start_codon:yes stop_codon:yes gene_type:complete
MAKKSDNPDAEPEVEETTDEGAEDQATDQATDQPEAAAPPAAQAPQQVQVQVDDSEALCCYSNFCRVTGSPEELIIDFGLNPQPTGIPQNPIKVSQRIVVNFYTAKRLLAALSMSVQRHEQVFGVLETDVSKRVNTPT